MAVIDKGVIVLPGNMDGVPGVKNLKQLVENFSSHDLLVYSAFTDEWRNLDRENPLKPGALLHNLEEFQDVPVLMRGDHGPGSVWRAFSGDNIMNSMEFHYDPLFLLSYYFAPRLLPNQRYSLNILGLDQRSYNWMMEDANQGLEQRVRSIAADVNQRIQGGANFPLLLVPYNGTSLPDEYSDECVPIENTWELRDWIREQLSSFATARRNWVVQERFPLEPGRMRAWITFPSEPGEGEMKLHCLEDSPEDPYEGEIEGCEQFIMEKISPIRDYTTWGRSMAVDLARLNVSGPRGMTRGSWVVTGIQGLSHAEGVRGFAPRHIGWDE